MSPADNNEPLVMEGHYVELEKTVVDLLKEPPVKVTIDGKSIEIPRTTLVENPVTGKVEPKPTTIYDAALKLDIKIPILCHREHMTPVAACRFCTVDAGGRVLTAACHRQVEPNMVVHTGNADTPQGKRVRNTIKVLTELLLADHEVPREAHKEYGDNELRTIAKNLGLNPYSSRFPKSGRDRGQTSRRSSSPSITTPASCATAASAAATKCATTRSWAGWARGTRRTSPSTSTTRWANRAASRAASA